MTCIFYIYWQHSQVILKLFLSDGMPVLEALLKFECDDVTGMLKMLQVTTRFLHTLCISTKVTSLSWVTIITHDIIWCDFYVSVYEQCSVQVCENILATLNEYTVIINTTIHWFLLIQITWLHVLTRIFVIFRPIHYTKYTNYNHNLILWLVRDLHWRLWDLK